MEERKRTGERREGRKINRKETEDISFIIYLNNLRTFSGHSWVIFG